MQPEPVPATVSPHPSIFAPFEPVEWYPLGRSGGKRDAPVYSVTRDHGIRSEYRLHNPNDEINEGRSYFNKIVLEYRINKLSYDFYTIRDLYFADYLVDSPAAGNIIGDIGERIARRIVKYFLKHYDPAGKTGGIFDSRFDPRNRENFIVAHSERYVLKISRYPNLIILKRSGRGKYGYENIKEIDGFFDYRHAGRRNIIVLESKIEKIKVNSNDLITSLFLPLKELFPRTRFFYCLFTTRNGLYHRRAYRKRRQLKSAPVRIYDRLKREGIGTIFFSFNETREDFERMKNHLIMQYRLMNKMKVAWHGRTMVTNKEITLFDYGETPSLKLIKDTKSGFWKEIPLRHKRAFRTGFPRR